MGWEQRQVQPSERQSFEVESSAGDWSNLACVASTSLEATGWIGDVTVRCTRMSHREAVLTLNHST